MLELQRAGAQILDTRDPGEFAAAHLVGSQNIGLGGQYATWAGTILSRQQPIVIIAETGREMESALRLGRIGFDNVVGYLKDGLRSLESRPELTGSTDRLSPAVAAERLASNGAAAAGRCPHASRVRREAHRRQSLHSAQSSGGALSELPADRPLLVHCAGGYRSSIAASLVQQQGFEPVSELAGGIAAWEAAGLPIASASA